MDFHQRGHSFRQHLAEVWPSIVGAVAIGCLLGYLMPWWITAPGAFTVGVLATMYGPTVRTWIEAIKAGWRNMNP